MSSIGYSFEIITNSVMKIIRDYCKKYLVCIIVVFASPGYVARNLTEKNDQTSEYLRFIVAFK